MKTRSRAWPRARRRRRDTTRGAAAVEFALVLTLLLTLLMGMIDFAYYFWVDHVVTGAAREGARSAATWDNDAQAQEDAEAVAVSYLQAGGFSSASASAVDVSFETVTIPGPATTSDVVVEVTWPAGSLTGFFGAGLLPANASYTARFRREPF